MDPLSHALVGGLAAKTCKTSKRRFWIMVLLGNVPDLDVVFNGLGGWAFMFQHRGLSHSVIGIALQALLFAWILGYWDKGPFKQRVFHYALPITFHLVADYLTCYGVPLWAPFTFKEYSGDLIHSVNLIPMVFMGSGLVWLYRRQLHGWQHARIIWAAWVFYLAFSLTGKAYASRLTEMPHQTLTTLPSIANPFSWHGMYLDESTQVYHSYAINLLDRKSQARVFAMPKADLPVQASMKSREVQTFLKHNRWPVVRTSMRGTNVRVEWGTVLFSSRGIARGKVAVDVSPSGEILHEEKILNFWDPA